jgi:hypothetical protein
MCLLDRCHDVVEFGEPTVEHRVDELLDVVLQRANLLTASSQRFFRFAIFFRRTSRTAPAAGSRCSGNSSRRTSL